MAHKSAFASPQLARCLLTCTGRVVVRPHEVLAEREPGGRRNERGVVRVQRQQVRNGKVLQDVSGYVVGETGLGQHRHAGVVVPTRGRHVALARL